MPTKREPTKLEREMAAKLAAHERRERERLEDQKELGKLHKKLSDAGAISPFSFENREHWPSG